MAVCEVLTQYINQGTKVDTQQPVEERQTDKQLQRTESESQKQERESESSFENLVGRKLLRVS